MNINATETPTNPYLNPGSHTIGIHAMVDGAVEWSVYVHARTKRTAIKHAESWIKSNMCESDYSHIERQPGAFHDRDVWRLY